MRSLSSKVLGQKQIPQMFKMDLSQKIFVNNNIRYINDFTSINRIINKKILPTYLTNVSQSLHIIFCIGNGLNHALSKYILTHRCIKAFTKSTQYKNDILLLYCFSCNSPMAVLTQLKANCTLEIMMGQPDSLSNYIALFPSRHCSKSSVLPKLLCVC